MRLINHALICFLSIIIAAYALFVYSFLPLGVLLHPDMMSNFVTHSTGIYAHIFASSLALIIGPFQFSSYLREQYPQIHRWLGRLYLGFGILIGGLAGLYMAFFAFGGVVAKLGFGVLAVLWLYTGVRAYLAIRQGAIAEHKKWMIRNFALTFAAVMLRIYLPLSLAAGIEFEHAYPIIAWLCWIPNLIFVEWRYNHFK